MPTLRFLAFCVPLALHSWLYIENMLSRRKEYGVRVRDSPLNAGNGDTQASQLKCRAVAVAGLSRAVAPQFAREISCRTPKFITTELYYYFNFYLEFSTHVYAPPAKLKPCASVLCPRGTPRPKKFLLGVHSKTDRDKPPVP